jgi:dienelactone hydrolase
MKTIRFVSIALCLWVLSGCGQAVQAPLLDPQATSPVELDVNSAQFFETQRHLFDYDPEEPLDIVDTGNGRHGDVAAYDFTYRSPKGGRVPATLLVPNGAGPYPGIVMMHGMPSDRGAMLAAGTLMAQVGSVVILIDAPFARPENAGRDAMTFAEQDREEQIQLIVDLRRAVDVLLTRPEVDASRLAYFGVSYGGAMGGLLAGVEDRLQAYVLVVGDGGLVTHVTGSEDWPNGDLFRLPESRQDAWLDAMWPIEPLHYVGHAAPAALLFQNGTQDPLVSTADALRYQEAGSEPKTIIWYEAGHGLPPEAFRDAVHWLEDYLAAGDLLLLETSFRPAAVVVDRLLLVWLVLTCGSLVYLLWDLVRDRSATWATGLAWALTGLFFGPLALLAYLLLYRSVIRSPEPGVGLSNGQRALGSTLWSAGRNLSGGVLALAILLALPAASRDNMSVRLPLVLLLPLVAGLLVYACTQWAARSGGARWIFSRRPLGTELVTTVAFLVGAYPLVIWLGDGWMATWYPFGADLSNPAQWIVLILAAWAGAAVASPAHLWLIGSGRLRWGPKEREDHETVR